MESAGVEESGRREGKGRREMAMQETTKASEDEEVYMFAADDGMTWARRRLCCLLYS